MNNLRIFIDTEFAYKEMFLERRMPKQEDSKEIVQIAALKWDTLEHKEIAFKNYFITPYSLKELPPFFVELTNIDDTIVKTKGTNFEEVLEDLIIFCKDSDIWTFNNDYHVFTQNCEMRNIFNPFKTAFTRVKPLLSKWGIDPDKYSSGTLYQAAGLNMKGHVHNALHDVRSMARAVDYFESQIKS